MNNLYGKIQCVFILFISSFILISCGTQQPKLRGLLPGAVILAFGDSLTFGTGASPETSYPQDLQTLTHFKVVNAGVPGDETKDGLDRIQNALDQAHPQLVIVCLGGNDLLRKRPVAQIKDNLTKIIQIIQHNGAQILLIGVPELSFTLTVPDFYQELGDEFHIPVINDLLPRLLKTPEYKSDYIHFNAAGYKQMAEAIASFLKQQGALNVVYSSP